MLLSVIIITRNEERNISACLQSVAFADEVLVLDSMSTDQTAEIARACGARVVPYPQWSGFGAAKNAALSHAQGEWVLSLDADERVSPALQQEILMCLANPIAEVYAIPRRSWFCGRFIAHAGWSPDYVVRLFRRGGARFSDDLVHEKLIFSAKEKTLIQPLIHYSFNDLSQVLQKMDAYSTASAEQKYRAGARASVGKALIHGLWAFIRTYFLRAGFLDGAQGLALSIANAEGSYYRYMKLWLMHQKNAHD